MKRQVRHHHGELAIIGSGLAGFAASIFALESGIKTVLIGNTGAVAYTTGYFDLLGTSSGKVLRYPWQGLEDLQRNEPDHPLSRIANDDINRAFCQFTSALTKMGIGYTEPSQHNLSALLPGGVVKPTLSVPETMLPGIKAHAAGSRALIIDFVGLQGFSAKEMVANLKSSWPNLSSTTLAFPDMEKGDEVYAEVMARALEVPANRQRLADLIKDKSGDAEIVGLPAILGIHNPDTVHHDMERLIGLPVFEIPTIPPSVPGIRLREMFEYRLPDNGLTLLPQQKVQKLDLGDAGITLSLSDSFGDVVIEAQAVILATGRFLSGGLTADREIIRETLLDLPVKQPDNRNNWHRQNYFDLRGHPVNRSGVNIDESFRPLNKEGQPVDQRLFAAGTLLAHQDWIRQRCGAGVAIATASKAVEAAVRLLTLE